MPVFLQKRECIYDASQSVDNSFDWVADTSATDDAGIVAQKSLFVNLETLASVSKEFLEFDAALQSKQPLQYLEMRHQRRWKAPDRIRAEAEIYCIEQTHVAAGATPTGITLPSVYRTTTQYVLIEMPGAKIMAELQIDYAPATWGSSGVERQGSFKFKEVQGVDSALLQRCAEIAGASSIPPESNALLGHDGTTAQEVTVPPLPPNRQKFRVSPNPAEWKCMDCGRTINLWLNLADGYIGCGRKQWGVEASGCEDGREGAAVRHFEANRDLHVTLKLGTISRVTAETYSYIADDFVTVVKLDELLMERFGIQRDKLTGGEKTTQELAAESNQALSYGMPVGDDEKKREIHERQGLMGMINLGNTCYISSLLQVLEPCLGGLPTHWQIAKNEASNSRWIQQVKGYLEQHGIRETQAIIDNSGFQLFRLLAPLRLHPRPELAKWRSAVRAKVAAVKTGLPPELRSGIGEGDVDFKFGAPTPSFFKRTIGMRNRDFASSQQQDAEEFYQLLFTMMESVEKSNPLEGTISVTNALGFKLVTKRQGSSTSKFSLSTVDCPLLALELPRNESARHEMTLEQLLEAWRTADVGQTQGLKTYPPYLLVEFRRMVMDPITYRPTKLSEPVSVPTVVDFGAAVPAPTLLFGEEEEKEPTPQPSAVLMETLANFGFTPGQIRAAFHGTGHSVDTELLATWMFENPGKEENEPSTVVAGGAESSVSVDSAAVAQLVMFGFEPGIAARALKTFGGDVERAADALFSGQVFPEEERYETPASPPQVIGEASISTKYKLVGVVVHLGAHGHSGHYVAYKRDGAEWFLLNDTTVSRCSQDVDLRHGYLYMFERM